jgi:phosphoribosylamine--glycine ligase
MIDGPLAPVLAAAADGDLTNRPIALRRQKHVGVVLASRDYPRTGSHGLPISGLDQAAELDDVLVFHAGTAAGDDQIVTAGGRVLTVVGRDRAYEGAIARAYEAASLISFEGMQYRRDIGRKALDIANIANIAKIANIGNVGTNGMS